MILSFFAKSLFVVSFIAVTFGSININSKLGFAEFSIVEKVQANSEGVVVDLSFGFEEDAIECLKNFYNNITAKNFAIVLDCMARQDVLSRLGGQWIVLRKSHWSIHSFSANTTYFTANNFFDPTDKHSLVLKAPTGYNTGQMINYLRYLQDYVFPKLLQGVSGKNGHLTTKISFDATSHHYAGLHTAGAFDWPKKSTKYRSMVAWAENPNRYLQTLLDRYPYYRDVLALDPIGPKYWGEFARDVESRKRDLYSVNSRLVHCNSKCFERQEAHLVGGLMMALSHKDLVLAVNSWLPHTMGCVPLEARENLNGVFGYYRADDINESLYRPTGGRIKLNFDFSNWARFGRWALLGRPLYVRAQISERVPESHLGLQGENFLVYNISDKTAKSIAQMGGFGAVNGSKDIPAPFKGSTEDTINYIHFMNFTGMSKLMMEYWIANQKGESRRAKEIKNMPDTPYKIYVYDYQLSGSYYNAVLRGVKNLPGL